MMYLKSIEADNVVYCPPSVRFAYDEAFYEFYSEDQMSSLSTGPGNEVPCEKPAQRWTQ